MAKYPKRNQCFAHNFCRLLFKQQVANEIGAQACLLLHVIVHAEDARHYTGAVTFFNPQLLPSVGLGSVDALERVRRKAIEAGWLHYEPGAKRVPGRYWVTIPGESDGLNDGPIDEGVTDDVIVADTTAKSRQQPRSKCGRNRGECADPSSLTPDPAQKTPQPPAEPGGGKNSAAPWKNLARAIAEVTGLDRATKAGRQIDRTAKLLANADPPYTPAEFHEFGKRFWEFCPWAKDKRQARPTVGELGKWIGRIRAGPMTAAGTGAGVDAKRAAQVAERQRVEDEKARAEVDREGAANLLRQRMGGLAMPGG